MTMEQEADIAGLVRSCRSGNPEAFSPLVRCFQGAGFAVALGLVREPQDAEDVLQDAFVTAYCRLSQLADPEAFPGWFRQIVVAQSRDWLRRRGVRQRHADRLALQALADGPGAGPVAEQRMCQQRLWEQVFALREPLRATALLRYLSGFSQREVAAFLQVPVSTVNGRLQQARQRLRRVLTEADLEDMTLSEVDVSAEVADAVYQIATEPLSATADVGDIDSIVLYCGVNADIAIEACTGSELRIEGSSVSMGLSQEEAQESARATHLVHDRVEDFLHSGPHPGELFAGTNMRNGEPETVTAQTTDHWRAFCHGRGAGICNSTPADQYPHLADRFLAFPEPLRRGLERVLRVSLVQEKVQALTLPPDAYRERLHKVFRRMADHPKWLHGPVGRVSVTVRVPEGKALTVMRADSVEAKDLLGPLNLVQCHGVDVCGVAGDVCLADTAAMALRRIDGNLLVRFYGFGGMSWHDDEPRARRCDKYQCRIEDVSGDVDLEVGRMELELARIAGSVQVMNRYGDTRFHAAAWPEGSRCRLETVSGRVKLFLHEKLVPDLRLTAVTLCGSLSYDAYRDLDKGLGNTSQLAYLSTVKPLRGVVQDIFDADLMVRTESGDVEIERVL